MGGVAEREARLLAAIYRTYGLAADWAPVGGGVVLHPTVRLVVEDVEVGYGDSFDIQRRTVVYVRLSEVPRATAGASVTIGASTYTVIAQPKLEKIGLEWLCEVSEV